MSVSVDFLLEHHCETIKECNKVIKWFTRNARETYGDEVKSLKITVDKQKYNNVFTLSFRLNGKNVPLNRETAHTYAEGILDPLDKSDYPGYDSDSDNRRHIVAEMVESTFRFMGPPPSVPMRRCPNGQRKNTNRVCVDYVPKTRTRCPNGQRKNKSRKCEPYMR